MAKQGVFSAFCTMDPREIFGKNVRRIRRAADMSQEELGLKILGADQGYVSRLENGAGNPTLLQIAAIAAALRVHPCALFEDLDIGKAQNDLG